MNTFNKDEKNSNDSQLLNTNNLLADEPTEEKENRESFRLAII